MTKAVPGPSFVSDRKRSIELNNIRCQLSTDEDRINKLTSFPITRQIE